MKFLVLALCACAASAATIPETVSYDESFATTIEPIVKAYSPIRPEPVVESSLYPKPVQRSLNYNQRSFTKESDAPVLKMDNNVMENGFKYSYETGNGISAGAVGSLKKVKDTEVITIEGGFQYPGTDGKTVELTYTADENGYHPKGDILPTPPPMPAFVYQLLKYLAEHPTVEPIATKY